MSTPWGIQKQLREFLRSYFVPVALAICFLYAADHVPHFEDMSTVPHCPVCPSSNPNCLDHRPTLTFLNLGRLGRLGNHLFQAAATVGVAAAHDLCWAFPAASESSDIGRLLERNLWHLNLTGGTRVPVHFEQNQNYYEVELPIDDEDGPLLSLAGYFQSPRYFDYYRNTIRELFAFKSELIEAVDSRFPAGTLDRAVGLHVRRGDYADEPQTYINLSVDYYIEALDKLDARIAGGIGVVVVVSDDIEWCRRELESKLPFPLIFSPFGEEKNENGKYLDFVLLASCRYLVIANSSFSWWAAYLKREAEKGLVVAPKPWYGRKSRLGHISNTIDFYPTGWLIVDTEQL